ncbi:MAG: hypothetical protein DLM68_18800 [Hyphomicrobiales bacterium]|nr:MAG: hypothetical protein DLM68_18800 [Hyphomicrobiales bacterium]
MRRRQRVGGTCDLPQSENRQPNGKGMATADGRACISMAAASVLFISGWFIQDEFFHFTRRPLALPVIAPASE